jgi:hypothetical protein
MFLLKEREAFAFFLIFMFIYVISNFSDLFVDECQGFEHCYDFDRRMARLYVWNFDTFFDDFRHSIHFGLLVLSYGLFGNYKVLPFASSIIGLVLVFLITRKVSNGMLGVVSCIVVLLSSIFRGYDISVTYPSFWATGFLFCIYLTVRGSKFSSIPYFISIPMKSLLVWFMPAYLAFVSFLPFPIGRKESIVIVFLAILVVSFFGLAVLVEYGVIQHSYEDLLIDFNLGEFISGTGSWANSYRDDPYSLIVMFFVICCLLMIRDVAWAKSFLYLLLGMILVSPFITGFTTYDHWSYRFFPNIMLSAVGLGIVLNNIKELKIQFKKTMFPVKN